jgi:Subtilase family
MLSRCLLRAALTAGCLSLLALLAAPAAAAAPAGAGFGASAAPRLIRDLRAAWRISTGQGVTVAVLYGGVDPTAPGLAGVVTTGPSFGNVAADTDELGTVFASAVAGRGPGESNPAGTLGLAPAARILSIEVPQRAAGGAWQRDTASAIRYAARHGAQVIYVSGESFRDAAVLDSAVEYATARNAVVISAEFPLRRGSPDASTVPGSLPGVLGAASVVLPGLTQPPYRIPSPANESILVSAPANLLTVSGPLGQGYQLFDYLAAGAWLTATAALIKSVHPHLPVSLVDLALARSAQDHPRGGYSARLGFGLLNPVGALHEAAALAKVPVTAPTGPGSLAASARLGPGPPPGIIDAVHHSTIKLALYGMAMAAGLLLLGMAGAAALRWRSRPA